MVIIPASKLWTHWCPRRADHWTTHADTCKACGKTRAQAAAEVKLATDRAEAQRLDVVSPDPNVEALRKAYLDRSLHGVAKYGTTTARTDLDLPSWLQHLQEELMDATVYIQAQKGRAVVLERLAKLMRSYTPDLPMGPGMKAAFLDLREELEKSYAP